VHRVRVFQGQAELALDEPGAAAGVDGPARRAVLQRLAGALPTHAVRRAVRAEFDLADERVVDELDAAALAFLGQEVLEDAAVELVARHRQGPAGAQFGDAVQVAPAVAEEEAEAELAQLRALQMCTQPEHVLEVVGADLDRGLAHLVAGLGHRVRPAFEHQHVQRGQAQPQLQRQRQAGQAAAHDDDVMQRHGSGRGAVHLLRHINRARR